jgi:hypothetical protein
MANEEQKSDVEFALDSGVRGMLGVGAAVGLIAGAIMSWGAHGAFGGGGTGQSVALLLPAVGYVALIVVALRKLDSSALVLGSALGIFPIVAAPLALLMFGVMGGGTSRGFFLLMLSPLPGGLVLALAALIALFTSKPKVGALGLVGLGTFLGAVFWFAMFNAYQGSAMAQRQEAHGTTHMPVPRKPSLEEQRLYFHIAACEVAYKKGHSGIAATSLEDLGPDGNKCLSAEDIGGGSARLKVEYSPNAKSDGGFVLGAQRADGSGVDYSYWWEMQDSWNREILYDVSKSIAGFPSRTPDVYEGGREKGRYPLPAGWTRVSPTSFEVHGLYLTEQEYVVTYSTGAVQGDFYLDMRPVKYAESGLYSYHADVNGAVYRTNENRPATDADASIFFRSERPQTRAEERKLMQQRVSVKPVPDPRSPVVTNEERQLYFRVELCEAAFRNTHDHKSAHNIEELGPTGTKCLKADDLSGRSAHLTHLQFGKDAWFRNFTLSAQRPDGKFFGIDRSIHEEKRREQEEWQSLASCLAKSEVPQQTALVDKGKEEPCIIPAGWTRVSPRAFKVEETYSTVIRYFVRYSVGPTRNDFFMDIRPAKYGKTEIWSYHIDGKGEVWATLQDRAAEVGDTGD